MAKRNRSTLRNYFRVGAMPSAEHFADLVDSSINKLEEGFDKTPEDGFKVSSLEDNAKLVSFYRDTAPNVSLWSISYDARIDSLLFHHQDQTKTGETAAEPVLSMTQQGRVGVNTVAPAQALDVNGVVKSIGRMGTQPLPDQNVPADGQWHNITELLEGCHALEVVAGVGIKRKGRYALLRAVALNTCNPTGFWSKLFNWKNPIKCQQAYYKSSADKLNLRWVAAEHDGDSSAAYRPYYLQARSNTDYGEGYFIRYHITQLWFDDYMLEGHVSPDESL